MRVSRSDDDERPRTEIPENARVVVARDSVRGPVPEGLDDEDEDMTGATYHRGDEFPKDQAERILHHYDRSFILVDGEDGEILDEFLEEFPQDHVGEAYQAAKIFASGEGYRQGDDPEAFLEDDETAEAAD